MLQIRKIYIQNFKGVYSPSIIDLDNQQLTILSGPNGFGKTTIFDVMELCLRGRLNRTMTYNNVTKKNAGHKKPFYQNTSGEDVLLKLWVTKGDENHVIIKRLDRETAGSRNNAKPFRPDAWDLIDSYHTTDVSTFAETPDYTSLNSVDQVFIDQLFLGETGLSMENLYPLFNYLQQEDNIYFLKKDEDTKKNELAFLFQTQKESDDLEKVIDKHSTVVAVRDALRNRIAQLGTGIHAGNMDAYVRLFPEQEYAFDAENPFVTVPADQLEAVHLSLQASVSQLLNFISTFSPQQFQRRKLRNQLRTLANSRSSMLTLVAKNLAAEPRFTSLREVVDRNAKYRTYLTRLGEYTFDSHLLGELGLTTEFIQDFGSAISRRSTLLLQIGEIGRIIRELNGSREGTMARFAQLHERHPQDSNCPLCNAHWETMSDLEQSYAKKTENLAQYNRSQQSELNTLETEIKGNFIAPITQAIESYLSSPENLIDSQFFTEVSERRGNLESVNAFMAKLETENIDISSFIINDPVTMERLNENIARLQSVLNIALDAIQIDDSQLNDSELYTLYFNEDEQKILREEEVANKQAYLNAIYSNIRNLSLNVLSDRLEKTEQLERRILTIKENLNAAIKSYKKTMIEKIKIPFYMYSGKILQHYQQGYGIFVDVKDTTSRVRFLTGENTDHDIIHQLSSGQLAVVSIAFCLALNKVYQAPQHFKFLAIDDPVQTLDDLNIHSFIELLRHEFMDYKMVISTHEEHIANYLLYKFEKFQFSNQKLNVQENFYNSIEG